eukprot:CAMPEP_0170520198 /NCGR_PEP_ID=MMETSP0209-20121228/5449_1 /TAXON_ID=665100 ORGANISM="Litonotus pictus, Strain P1" /NCGR_SAMPLE_ID=MMETSP0209 /ASSEMBLY_ACC=CAM_ASM_000301 /LENGTH=73 /DNA_ID=CAMNT_0010806357 /DNA_START=254 /DNA_END=475 /DNA_ORIENTATION=+
MAKLQSYEYVRKTPYGEENMHQRQNRLKNKWILDAELWMLAILIIEWISIFRLMRMFTKRCDLEAKIKTYKSE